MVVRLLSVVEARLGGRVRGEDIDGKRNLPGLLVGMWVGGDIGVEEDVDSDLVCVGLRKLCGVLGDFIVLS
jgi:hypothetical protein